MLNLKVAAIAAMIALSGCGDSKPAKPAYEYETVQDLLNDFESASGKKAGARAYEYLEYVIGEAQREGHLCFKEELTDKKWTYLAWELRWEYSPLGYQKKVDASKTPARLGVVKALRYRYLCD